MEEPFRLMFYPIDNFIRYAMVLDVKEADVDACIIDFACDFLPFVKRGRSRVGEVDDRDGIKDTFASFACGYFPSSADACVDEIAFVVLACIRCHFLLSSKKAR